MTDQPFTEAASALVVPVSIWVNVLAHLRAALPNEGVGLLGTSRSDAYPGSAVTEVFYPGRNAKASPIRYDLDMRDLVHALGDIDDRNLSLGAIVHSHPTGEPFPSPTDLREAYYPESLMVIVSFATGDPIAKAWRLQRVAEAWQPENVPIRVVGRAGEIACEGEYRE